MAEPFMDGGYVEFSGLDRMTIVDPANGEEVGTVPAGGVAEVNQAVRSAHEAFLAWRDTPAAKRGEILGKAAHAVLSATEELAPVLTSEQGKPLREARLEIRRFVHTLEHYVGLAKSIRGGYVPDLDARNGANCVSTGRLDQNSRPRSVSDRPALPIESVPE